MHARDSALIASGPAEKIRIFALLELLRDIPADCRTVAFSAIAERTKLPEHEVELLLMKSLSLKLVKGVISGVDSTVRVTWVIPRVMDRDSIKKQLVKLSDWMDKVRCSCRDCDCRLISWFLAGVFPSSRALSLCPSLTSLRM